VPAQIQAIFTSANPSFVLHLLILNSEENLEQMLDLASAHSGGKHGFPPE